VPGEVIAEAAAVILVILVEVASLSIAIIKPAISAAQA